MMSGPPVELGVFCRTSGSPSAPPFTWLLVDACFFSNEPSPPAKQPLPQGFLVGGGKTPEQDSATFLLLRTCLYPSSLPSSSSSQPQQHLPSSVCFRTHYEARYFHDDPTSVVDFLAHGTCHFQGTTSLNFIRDFALETRMKNWQQEYS